MKLWNSELGYPTAVPNRGYCAFIKVDETQVKAVMYNQTQTLSKVDDVYYDTIKKIVYNSLEDYLERNKLKPCAFKMSTVTVQGYTHLNFAECTIADSEACIIINVQSVRNDLDKFDDRVYCIEYPDSQHVYFGDWKSKYPHQAFECEEAMCKFIDTAVELGIDGFIRYGDCN